MSVTTTTSVKSLIGEKMRKKSKTSRGGRKKPSRGGRKKR